MSRTDRQKDFNSMNIIEKYHHLMENKQWEEAIPVTEEIIARDPSIDTSWFNYGVCLEMAGRYSEAIDAFIKAHELNVSDYGIHYRILKGMYLAKDQDQFFEFVDYLCLNFKDEVAVIFESDEFTEFESLARYKELKAKYYILNSTEFSETRKIYAQNNFGTKYSSASN